MAYSKILWKNQEESTSTPINATNLNHMDDGIYNAHSLVGALSTTVDNKTKAATTSSRGTVKPDGSTISVTSDGTISAKSATATTRGTVKADGLTTRIASDGTITAVTAGGGGASTALQVSYADEVTQLGTNNVQGAIESLNTDLASIYSDGFATNMIKYTVGNLGKYLTSSGGMGSVSDRSLDVTDYTEIKANTHYIIDNIQGNSASVCWYDTSENFIGGKSYDGNTIVEFDTPNNAKYIRATVKHNSIANIYEKAYAKSNVQLTNELSNMKDLSGEALVGVLDGVNVYERVIAYKNQNLTVNTSVIVDSGFLDPRKIIKLEAYVSKSASTLGGSGQLEVWVNNYTQLTVLNGLSSVFNDNATLYVTVRYVK